MFSRIPKEIFVALESQRVITNIQRKDRDEGEH